MEILENIEGWRIVQGYEDAVDADATLVRAAQQGDLAAMEGLFARHERAIVTVCYSVLGSREDAEDAAQEAFILAVRGLKGFRGSSAFRTWLYRIAVNTCLNHKRRSKSEERWLDVASGHSVASPEQGALTRIHAAQALSRLMPRQRAVIILREVQGLSAQEIGQTMGWNEQKVRNELFRARQVLREWARGEGREAE